MFHESATAESDRHMISDFRSRIYGRRLKTCLSAFRNLKAVLRHLFVNYRAGSVSERLPEKSDVRKRGPRFLTSIKLSRSTLLCIRVNKCRDHVFSFHIYEFWEHRKTDYRTWMPGVTGVYPQISAVAEEGPVPKVKGKIPWEKNAERVF